jgi:class 3 adenylate cyclase
MAMERVAGRRAAATGGGVRAAVWFLHMALPLLGLWLFLARPEADLRWEHHPSHFWLVMLVAATNVIVALGVEQAARRHGDVRLLLVSFGFVAAAGFLLLHALATPGVLMEGRNGGFEVATPVGLALASGFFALSSFDLRAERARRIVARAWQLRVLLLGVMVLWAVATIAGFRPLAQPLPEQAEGPLFWVAVVGVALYLLAAFRYYLLYRRRPAVLLIALITASVLLAEAMVVVMVASNWQLSWWEWHLLMAIGFAFVAYSSYVQFRREGSAIGLFNGITTDQTFERIRREYGGALDALTSALERAEAEGLSKKEVELITVGLGVRFNLSEGQTEVLGRAARALADERDQVRRLGALAEVATEARVGLTEEELLTQIVSLVEPRFGRDVMRIGVVGHGGIEYPAALTTGTWPEEGDDRTYPLEIRGRRVGMIEFSRAGGEFGERDLAILETLASEVTIALDNTRLYRQVNSLFHQYLSPDVAATLLADPAHARLGGAVVGEVTALFADLRGFTSFSERFPPEAIVELLNRYFGLAVPIILENGGTVLQFVGDAILAIFNAPNRQEDHALRAAHTALAIQATIADAARQQPTWPRFRIGLNTGPALVGNVGSTEIRAFNVMGDAVNIAARLQTLAEPGTVVVGPDTYRLIASHARVTPLGDLALKGKDLPVEAYVLEGLSVELTEKPVAST